MKIKIGSDNPRIVNSPGSAIGPGSRGFAVGTETSSKGHEIGSGNRAKVGGSLVGRLKSRIGIGERNT